MIPGGAAAAPALASTTAATAPPRARPTTPWRRERRTLVPARNDTAPKTTRFSPRSAYGGPTSSLNGSGPVAHETEARQLRRKAETLLRAGGATPENAFSLALDSFFAGRGAPESDKALVKAYAVELQQRESVDVAYTAALDAYLNGAQQFRAQRGAPGPPGTPPPKVGSIDASSLMTRAERPMNSPMASNLRRAQPADQAELQQAAQPDVSMGEEVDEDEDDESAGDFDPYLFMKHLPPKSAACREGWDAAHPRLPPNATRKPVTLVLDLDETLVHSQMEPRTDADFVFDVQLCGVTSTVYVKARPRMAEFLDYASERFEVVIFTASHRAYAETLLDKIDPRRTRIQHRLYRDACATVDGLYLKDLDVLGRDLSKVAIVDNTPYVFGFQPDNAIPIESWYDDPQDRELDELQPLLDRMRNARDVRPLLVEAFGMRRRIEDADDSMLQEGWVAS